MESKKEVEMKEYLFIGGEWNGRRFCIDPNKKVITQYKSVLRDKIWYLEQTKYAKIEITNDVWVFLNVTSREPTISEVIRYLVNEYEGY